MRPGNLLTISEYGTPGCKATAVRIYLCLFLLLLQPVLFPQSVFGLEGKEQAPVVCSILFEGLRRTSPDFLRERLICKEGSQADEALLEEDLRRLWNLQLFSDVTLRKQVLAEGLEITFVLKEKFTYAPIVGLDLSKENLKFRIGAIDYNLHGAAARAMFAYTYYQRHSFAASYFRDNIPGSRWGWGFDFAREATREPTYFTQSSTTIYDLSKWTVGPTVQYEIAYQHRLKLTGLYLHENYEKRAAGSTQLDMGPESISFNKYLVKLGHSLSRLRHFYHYLHGWTNQSSLEMVYSQSPMQGINTDWFWKYTNETRYFHHHGKGNLAARLLLGASENTATPFPAFVKDNYLNLRGVGDRPERGSAAVNVSLEERWTVLHKPQLVIQAVLFTDAGTLLPAGQSVDQLFDGFEVFSGLGLRLQLPAIHHSVLRLDYGVAWQDRSQGAFLLGLGHFF